MSSTVVDKATWASGPGRCATTGLSCVVALKTNGPASPPGRLVRCSCVVRYSWVA